MDYAARKEAERERQAAASRSGRDIGPLPKCVKPRRRAQAELLHNDLLADDWPEVCTPIRKMEGIANRCAGQTFQGQSTAMVWSKRKIVLPTIAGSTCSSAIVVCGGLLEAVRG